MEKLEKIATVVGLVTGIPVLVGIVGWATGFFQNQNLEVQILVLAIILISVLVVGVLILFTVRRIVFPKKPRLVRAFNEPDTYIFHRANWRRIPDWQTRDYLAHLLGFRVGEEDITVVSKAEIEKLAKGAPIESIFTYSRDHQVYSESNASKSQKSS